MAEIVSERYALSLYEIAKDEGEAEGYYDELCALREVFEQNGQLIRLLTTPSIPFAEKKDILQNVFSGRVRPYMLNFLMLLTEKGRIGLFSDICEAYRAQYYFENGIVAVRVSTARPISEALTEKLKSKMQAVTGKKVQLQTAVDPSLLGGLIVKLEGEQYDGSLKNRLNELAATLGCTIA